MVHPNFLSGSGAVLSIFLSSVGASWASVPAGLWAIHNNNHTCKKSKFHSCFVSFAPIIIAGVLAIYGTIVAVLITSNTTTVSDDESAGYRSLTAGLVVGLACLASGGGMAHFLGKVQVQASYGSNVSSSNTNGVDSQITEQHEPLLASRRHETSVSTNTLCSIRFLMVMVFLEAIGLYGLIVSLLILSTGK
jgi:V-type H+-transporting ATPase 16kDa proteolipid subunit